MRGREKRQIKLPEPVKIGIRWRRVCSRISTNKSLLLTRHSFVCWSVRPSVCPSGSSCWGLRNACQARPRFIGVHISLTSGCQGLLLHRYFTGSGYVHHHPILPGGKKKKNVGGGRPCKWGSAGSLPSTASHLAPMKECWGANKSFKYGLSEHTVPRPETFAARLPRPPQLVTSFPRWLGEYGDSFAQQGPKLCRVK